MQEHHNFSRMAKTTKIIRKSIFTFLQNYHFFTSNSALFALPFSVSILLSQSLLVPSSNSLFPVIQSRLLTLFQAAGFPVSSEFFSFLTIKLSQTLCSSILALPFTLSFLILAKASVIQSLKKEKTDSFSSLISIFNPMFCTYVFNTFLIISANATAFCFLFLSFTFLEFSGFTSRNTHLILSAAGAVFYSVILANAIIISNLALVLSGAEKTGGFTAILKACVAMRGRTSTALSLALPANVALAGVEALFHYRIVRPLSGGPASSWMVMEGMLIAYIYSVFIVIDTVATFMFFKSCCKKKCFRDEEDEKMFHLIEIEDEDYGSCGYGISSKGEKELP
ncbi:uncharacterized protein LOC126671026 [Mercurialis annua]|uniref:uncharacterized protein LOC126671026 n=1 Tax=Mercurialis annua TaxID=3986 RepID=UPI002160C551|nr:uncharacterized protein LOC126671026 [Mercurialis annua]